MGALSSRRAFLESMLGVQLALALPEAGCRAPAAREVTGRLLGQSAATGHLLRDQQRALIAHVQALPPTRVGVVIVGGGPAGLSAADALHEGGYDDFVLLELEPEVGGTARGGSSPVTAYPWGAHYLPVPHRHHDALIALLRRMGVVTGEDDEGRPMVSEPHLVRIPEERLFYKGFWYPGLYLEAGASQRDLSERARWDRLVAHWVAYRDGAGRRAFTLPLRLASDAPEVRALDALSAAAFLAREGFRSQRLLWLLDYACRDDYGLTLADTSAWALLFYFAARIERPGEEPSDLISWPEGNLALVRFLGRAAGARARTGELVLDVVERGEHVEVLSFRPAERRGVRYLADRAIVATPRFVSERIVRSSREAGVPLDARYAPWLVANLHLRDRPPGHGAPLAWDNVFYDGPSLGYVCATHQRGSDYGPTVLTYYLPLTEDPKQGRAKLHAASYASLRDLVLLDLGRAHPGLASLVERLDVFRWGHAMVRPEVGSLTSATRRAAMTARGRVHFAHSDLSGVSLFEEAFDHGTRAAREVLATREG